MSSDLKRPAVRVAMDVRFATGGVDKRTLIAGKNRDGCPESDGHGAERRPHSEKKTSFTLPVLPSKVTSIILSSLPVSSFRVSAS